jgi:hypothetical protein
LCLDPFRGRDHVEASGQARGGVHDGERFGTVRQILDGRSVDLDLVERKAAQIAERGMAGPEIVQEDKISISSAFSPRDSI